MRRTDASHPPCIIAKGFKLLNSQECDGTALATVRSVKRYRTKPLGLTIVVNVTMKKRNRKGYTLWIGNRKEHFTTRSSAVKAVEQTFQRLHILITPSL